MTWILDILSWSPRPLRVCPFFFQSIFSLLFRLNNFYCSTFQFTDFFFFFTPFPSFCCWTHPQSLLFWFLYFFFGSLLYFLCLCWNFLFLCWGFPIFSLLSSMFVIVHESTFFKATLRSLLNNSNISLILGLAAFDWIFHPVWDVFSGFRNDKKYLFGTLTFSYYVMRPWVIFKPLVLISFLWHSSDKRRRVAASLLPGRSSRQIPHSASADTIGVAPSLLGKSWLSTQPLRHHCSEEWKDASLLPGGDEGPASPRGPSNTAGGPWLFHYRCRDASLSFRLVLHNSTWWGC